MYITEDLLTEWTGLTGYTLYIFYLRYKQHAPSIFLYNDLESIRQDILKFKNDIWISTYKNEIISSQKENKIKSLIKFWESKIIR